MHNCEALPPYPNWQQSAPTGTFPFTDAKEAGNNLVLRQHQWLFDHLANAASSDGEAHH